jgi:hypothetical protein
MGQVGQIVIICFLLIFLFFVFCFISNVTHFIGEDPDCSDSVIDINPIDHETYLGFYAPDGNAHNCGHIPFKKENAAMENLAKVVSSTRQIR